MDSTLPQPAARPLTAEDICWDLAPGSPWIDPMLVVDAALDALPVIDDDIAATAIVQLVRVVLDLRARTRAYQELVTLGLDKWHGRHLADIRRLHLRELRRQGKGAHR